MLRTVISKGNLYCKRSFGSKDGPWKKSVREIEVPVPWGKIAGKLWSGDDRQPILALHGWQDNAGSFNNLVPFLENCSILAIDLPGHGRSSWLPPGMIYSEFNYLYTIHSIRSHFGWERIKILAHSLSGMLAFTYASLFNKETEFVMSIDTLKFPSYDIDSYTRKVQHVLQKLSKFNNQPKALVPSYSEEEVMSKWLKATGNSMDEQSCKELMIRGTKKKEDGTLYFSRDPRLKIHTQTVSRNDQNNFKDIAKRIKNPYLVIKAKESAFFEKKEDFLEIIEVMRENSSDLRFHEIPGQHHLHMTNPLAVAEVLNPFIQSDPLDPKVLRQQSPRAQRINQYDWLTPLKSIPVET